MYNEQWADRLIAITGAGGGIGRSCATILDRLGARLLLLDQNEQALQATAQGLEASRHRTVCTRLESVDACTDALQDDEPLYGLIHMAGIYQGDDLGEEHRDVWDRTLAVNLSMVFDLVSAAVPRMSGEQAGRLVMATSVAYRRGSWDHLAYSASKGGVAALVRSLSRKLAPQVLVNAVAPGVIETGMPEQTIARRGDQLRNEIPLKRWGRPDEAASVAVFLCSDASSYVTGQIINVDGGMVNS